MNSPKGGRPGVGAEPQGTRPVRLMADLVEMLEDLQDVLKMKSAAILDPIVREQLQVLHGKHRTAIDRLKKLKAEFNQAAEKVLEEVEADAPAGAPARRRRKA